MTPRAGFVLVAVLALISVRLSADDRPNVLLIVTDDQRADTIHTRGNNLIRTPNLDRLDDVHAGLNGDPGVRRQPGEAA